MTPLDENLKAWHDTGYTILPGPIEFFFWDPSYRDKKGAELLNALEEYVGAVKAKDLLLSQRFKRFIEWVKTFEEEARPTLERLFDRHKIPPRLVMACIAGLALRAELLSPPQAFSRRDLLVTCRVLDGMADLQSLAIRDSEAPHMLRKLSHWFHEQLPYASSRGRPTDRGVMFAAWELALLFKRLTRSPLSESVGELVCVAFGRGDLLDPRKVARRLIKSAGQVFPPSRGARTGNGYRKGDDDKAIYR